MLEFFKNKFVAIATNIYSIYYNEIVILIMSVLVIQSCPTLLDPMDGSLPGSSVRGILQARILEWIAITFSRD